MPYLVLFYKGEEIARRALQGPVVVGRSPECELCVHDILLSRRHCKIEPIRAGWVVTDLQSKNGTSIDGEPVTQRILRDGDVLTIGKTRAAFRTGPLSKAPPTRPATRTPAVNKRPADPFEAMNDTVSGEIVFKERPVRSVERFPKPRPVPPELVTLEEDEVPPVETELDASSWESIYSGASAPVARASPPGSPLSTAPRAATPGPTAHLAATGAQRATFESAAAVATAAIEGTPAPKRRARSGIVSHPVPVLFAPPLPLPRLPRWLRAWNSLHTRLRAITSWLGQP